MTTRYYEGGVSMILAFWMSSVTLGGSVGLLVYAVAHISNPLGVLAGVVAVLLSSLVSFVVYLELADG